MSSLTQRIQQLAHKQTTKISKKAPRPTKHQLRQWQVDEPDSLQAKLAVSPYAAILASPMRQCTFHRKHYPSHLLARFGLGLDPTTYKPTAYPSEKDGRGYYLKLNRKVLDQIQTKESRRLFRGEVVYTKTMATHLEHVMIQALVRQAHTMPFIPLYYRQNQWTVEDGSPIEPQKYQCLLAVNPPPSSQDIQLYDLQTPAWEPLRQALQIPGEAMGVPKSVDTVSFAVDLYRFHQWVQSSSK
ncbi:hypothetical protein BC941DRAFT_435012 [Chlamydoabsidia padenii]|nr:hypothetical protein BC941DRAFT_435012 [Chlamydoabsidia padenii]